MFLTWTFIKSLLTSVLTPTGSNATWIVWALWAVSGYSWQNGHSVQLLSLPATLLHPCPQHLHFFLQNHREKLWRSSNISEAARWVSGCGDEIMDNKMEVKCPLPCCVPWEPSDVGARKVEVGLSKDNRSGNMYWPEMNLREQRERRGALEVRLCEEAVKECGTSKTKRCCT